MTFRSCEDGGPASCISPPPPTPQNCHRGLATGGAQSDNGPRSPDTCVQPVGVCASLHGCGPSGHYRPTTVVLLSDVMSSITFPTASVDPLTCDQVGPAHL